MRTDELALSARSEICFRALICWSDGVAEESFSAKEFHFRRTIPLSPRILNGNIFHFSSFAVSINSSKVLFDPYSLDVAASKTHSRDAAKEKGRFDSDENAGF